MTLDWAICGGLLCGAIAGGAARYGKLCTMSAIEDALIGHDYRGAKAWGLAAGAAIAATQISVLLGLANLANTPYSSSQWHVLGTVLGGLLFGLGMTLAGTCSFGLIVRSGGGDLRAAVTAAVVGIFAFALTAGVFAAVRQPLLRIGVLDLSSIGGSSLTSILTKWGGVGLAQSGWVFAAFLLSVVAITSRQMRRRPRLIFSALVMGLAIAAGWIATTQSVNALALDRPESLSFVAPVGRALLQFMMEPFRNVGFGVAAVAGAAAASLVVAIWRQEFRWEAFDDAREMRRHFIGAALMGTGGVFAHGCTIGQGLSAASTLSVSAPVFLFAVLLGAKLGLSHLIEGRSLWRLGS